MKKFLLLVMVVTSALTGFAQVDTAVKAPRSKHHKMHHQQYSCPMHPEMKSDKPGKCNECGMDLQASKKEKMKMGATQHYCCPMHPEVTSDKAGTCSKCGMDLKASKKEQMKMKELHGYSCPMHPDEKSDKAGKCAKCGMDLKPVKAKQHKS